MNQVVPLKIFDILKDVVQGDIEHFLVTVHGSNKKGEGYLGEMFFVSLKDKRNGNQLNVVVKQAFSEENIRNLFPIRDAFLNEIYFYKKVWPKFKKFQEVIPSAYRFDNVAKCLASLSKDHYESLVLENLKYDGFVLQDKKETLKRDTFEFIFKVYGRFHAISFAYKELNPEEFSELINEFTDVWKTFGGLKTFQESIRLTQEQSLDSLKPGVDNEVIEKYRHYLDDGVEMLHKSFISSKYVCITHGDCWSNNMMFKYDETGKLVDLKLLDFQMFRLGSPVCDLAYCLYSGGTKAIFDDVDHFLRIYYDSLSENLREYGCDPDKIYPFQAIKNEWKVYCQLGFIVGMMVWRGKMTYEDDAVDLTDLSNNEEDLKKFFETNYDKETFQRTMRDIILHLFENDYLF
ncbi:uncharacterized protein LOC108907575 [Anoplophora glabripennis]|uniref:uncharacterized protein LOC108907575 n=1 Tax=Anoplophora glabripennis TaxID=217634 RepID=UPI0008747E7E|nr:uncharacterized protein LOC108907575 [Anoplophora glabripennis]